MLEKAKSGEEIGLMVVVLELRFGGIVNIWRVKIVGDEGEGGSVVVMNF